MSVDVLLQWKTLMQPADAAADGDAVAATTTWMPDYCLSLNYC